MSTIYLNKAPMNTFGSLPKVGEKAPDFELTKADLTLVTQADFENRALLLNVFPSIDTQVCFSSIETFSTKAKNIENLSIACVSMDLPFALKRNESANDFGDLLLLSDFRNRDFGSQFGVVIADGPLAGLLARAVILLDAQHRVLYTELVTELNGPPDYDTALATWQTA